MEKAEIEQWVRVLASPPVLCPSLPRFSWPHLEPVDKAPASESDLQALLVKEIDEWEWTKSERISPYHDAGHQWKHQGKFNRRPAVPVAQAANKTSIAFYEPHMYPGFLFSKRFDNGGVEDVVYCFVHGEYSLPDWWDGTQRLRELNLFEEYEHIYRRRESYAKKNERKGSEESAFIKRMQTLFQSQFSVEVVELEGPESARTFELLPLDVFLPHPLLLEKFRFLPVRYDITQEALGNNAMKVKKEKLAEMAVPDIICMNYLKNVEGGTITDRPTTVQDFALKLVPGVYYRERLHTKSEGDYYLRHVRITDDMEELRRHRKNARKEIKIEVANFHNTFRPLFEHIKEESPEDIEQVLPRNLKYREHTRVLLPAAKKLLDVFDKWLSSDKEDKLTNVLEVKRGLDDFNNATRPINATVLRMIQDWLVKNEYIKEAMTNLRDYLTGPAYSILKYYSLRRVGTYALTPGVLFREPPPGSNQRIQTNILLYGAPLGRLFRPQPMRLPLEDQSTQEMFQTFDEGLEKKFENADKKKRRTMVKKLEALLKKLGAAGSHSSQPSESHSMELSFHNIKSPADDAMDLSFPDAMDLPAPEAKAAPVADSNNDEELPVGMDMGIDPFEDDTPIRPSDEPPRAKKSPFVTPITRRLVKREPSTIPTPSTPDTPVYTKRKRRETEGEERSDTSKKRRRRLSPLPDKPLLEELKDEEAAAATPDPHAVDAPKTRVRKSDSYKKILEDDGVDGSIHTVDDMLSAIESEFDESQQILSPVQDLLDASEKRRRIETKPDAVADAKQVDISERIDFLLKIIEECKEVERSEPAIGTRRTGPYETLLDVLKELEPVVGTTTSDEGVFRLLVVAVSILFLRDMLMEAFETCTRTVDKALARSEWHDKDVIWRTMEECALMIRTRQIVQSHLLESQRGYFYRSAHALLPLLLFATEHHSKRMPQHLKDEPKMMRPSSERIYIERPHVPMTKPFAFALEAAFHEVIALGSSRAYVKGSRFSFYRQYNLVH